MIDRGDARAFAIGRQMLDRVDAMAKLRWRRPEFRSFVKSGVQ